MTDLHTSANYNLLNLEINRLFWMECVAPFFEKQKMRGGGAIFLLIKRSKS